MSDTHTDLYFLFFFQWYLKDVFGLKTLDARGALVQCVFSDVKHVLWHSNSTVYEHCIEKWLT